MRISIKDCLDHPWFVGTNSAISKMRREAENENNEMAKFISYSNVDANVAQQ
jgi:predicted transcriptional regulator of viral defense system